MYEVLPELSRILKITCKPNVVRAFPATYCEQYFLALKIKIKYERAEKLSVQITLQVPAKSLFKSLLKAGNFQQHLVIYLDISVHSVLIQLSVRIQLLTSFSVKLLFLNTKVV